MHDFFGIVPVWHDLLAAQKYLPKHSFFVPYFWTMPNFATSKPNIDCDQQTCMYSEWYY